MLNLTFAELLQTVLATASFLLLVVPSGFLLGWSVDFLRFRTRSATEQLLWSFALSLPLGIVISNVLARYLPTLGPLALFLILDLAAFVMMTRAWRGASRADWNLDREARIVLLCLAGEVVYIWLAGMPIQIGHSLFEPVFSSDWEIRLPLIQAAVRDGIPPRNPFFTFHNVSPPSRYYYYWFSECAQVVRLVHTDARATLLASSVYAALSTVAVLFLCLKYLLPSSQSLRKRCLYMLGLCCVLGLDVIPSFLGLFWWHVHLRPEIEWWLTDRSPGVIGALMYAPHHVAGIACGFLTVLLLTTLLEGARVPSWRAVLTHGALIGLAFMAMVGTSTYVTMFFALDAAVLFVACLVWRRPRAALALLLAGLVSLLASVPYLHELTAKTVAAIPGAEATQLLGIKLRDHLFSEYVLQFLRKRRHVPIPISGHKRGFIRLLVISGLYLCETGFFAVVVPVQFWRDFRSGTPPRHSTKVLWLTAASVGVFFLCVASAPLQVVNDLGVHAGLVLRLLFVLWGAQVVAWYLAERQRRPWKAWQQWVTRLAVVFLALGLTMSVWQAVVERCYLFLLNAQVIAPAMPFPHAQHLATVYQDIYTAQSQVAKSLPKDAVIQSNPIGAYQTIFRLYQRRRQAAGDLSCEGNFGGDPALCRSFVPTVLQLFGTHAPRYTKLPRLRSTDADTSVSALSAACSGIGITAVLASNADPVWYRTNSWVWQGDLLYGNQHVRVIRCPGS